MTCWIKKRIYCETSRYRFLVCCCKWNTSIGKYMQKSVL